MYNYVCVKFELHVRTCSNMQKVLEMTMLLEASGSEGGCCLDILFFDVYIYIDICATSYIGLHIIHLMCLFCKHATSRALFLYRIIL